MGLIFQHDWRLPAEYHAGACNLLATAALGQIFLDHYLTFEQLIELGNWLRERGAITPQLKLTAEEAPTLTIQRTGELLGFPGLRGEQVGRIFQGSITFWPHVVGMFWNGVICKGLLSSGVNHFIVCGLDFYPYFNPAPRRRVFEVESYLLYRVWLDV